MTMVSMPVGSEQQKRILAGLVGCKCILTGKSCRVKGTISHFSQTPSSDEDFGPVHEVHFADARVTVLQEKKVVSLMKGIDYSYSLGSLRARCNGRCWKFYSPDKKVVALIKCRTPS